MCHMHQGRLDRYTPSQLAMPQSLHHDTLQRQPPSMARSNIEHPSTPFAYHTPASEHTAAFSRVNALLVALASLLRSHPGTVQDVLPHLSPDAPSSICPSYMTQRLPQRKLLDTLASLIAFHPHCSAAAVALEATPDRVGLYIAATTTNPAATATVPSKGPAPRPTDPELRADVETWLGLMRDIAHGRGPPSTKPPKSDSHDTDVMDLPDTQLAVAVFRTCYPTLRTRLRGLPLGVLLRKFECCATSIALVNLASLRGRDAQEEGLGRLCEHLEVLLRLTEPGDAAEIADARHFVALHVAGRFAARALRDEGFCAFLNGIDCETVDIVEQACLLSRLITSLVSIAKSSGMEGALALPWRVEWIPPPSTASSFDATIDPPLLREWLGGISWLESPFLDRPPDAATWPYSQAVDEILRDVPCGLVRTTSMTSSDDDEDSVGRHCYTLASAKVRPRMATSHCEMALLRYLVDPANAVLAYPYIATSHMSCYACTMLARVVGVVHGDEAEFMLSGCEAHVDLPWIAGLSDDGAVGWGADVVRALEEGLIKDLRSLVLIRTEQLVERGEVGVLETEMLNELLTWGQ